MLNQSDIDEGRVYATWQIVTSGRDLEITSPNLKAPAEATLLSPESGYRKGPDKIDSMSASGRKQPLGLGLDGSRFLFL
jgi:hypothetical protein